MPASTFWLSCATHHRRRRQAKKEKFYSGSYSTDVVLEDTLLPDFFKQIFGNAGTLLQPTPQNF